MHAHKQLVQRTLATNTHTPVEGGSRVYASRQYAQTRTRANERREADIRSREYTQCTHAGNQARPFPTSLESDSRSLKVGLRSDLEAATAMEGRRVNLVSISWVSVRKSIASLRCCLLVSIHSGEQSDSHFQREHCGLVWAENKKN